MRIKKAVKPASLVSYANETPELLSLLYDMDLMPEQLKEGTQDWSRMLILIYAWKHWRPRPNDPTTEQSKCKHEKWRSAKHPPRHCVECGIKMWDTGD